MYVHLTTLASGRFTDNSLAMWGAGSTTVSFVPWGPLDLGTLTATLRVEHLQQVLAP